MDRESLDPNFREFLKSLNSARVRYLVVGGYAVNYYGHHRSTKDLDIWIAVDESNAELLSKVMRTFGGFSVSQVPPALFLDRGKVFAFGREPVRIDILTSPSGVDFDRCYEKRRDVVWDGIGVPLISLDDLRANKEASGRLKDLSDLESLPMKWPLAGSLKAKRKRNKQ